MWPRLRAFHARLHERFSIYRAWLRVADGLDALAACLQTESTISAHQYGEAALQLSDLGAAGLPSLNSGSLTLAGGRGAGLEEGGAEGGQKRAWLQLWRLPQRTESRAAQREAKALRRTAPRRPNY